MAITPGDVGEIGKEAALGIAGGVEPGIGCDGKLSGGVSAGWGVGRDDENEGCWAISWSDWFGLTVFAAFSSSCLMRFAYCQVIGVKPKPMTKTAATGAQVGNAKVGLLRLMFASVGNAMTSAQYSSRALAKSNNCSTLSLITGPDAWLAREPRNRL